MVFPCWLVGHQLRVIGRPSASTHHYGCCKCKRQWSMNHDVRAVLPWLSLEGFYAETYGYDPSPEEVARRLSA